MKAHCLGILEIKWKDIDAQKIIQEEAAKLTRGQVIVAAMKISDEAAHRVFKKFLAEDSDARMRSES